MVVPPAGGALILHKRRDRIRCDFTAQFNLGGSQGSIRGAVCSRRWRRCRRAAAGTSFPFSRKGRSRQVARAKDARPRLMGLLRPGLKMLLSQKGYLLVPRQATGRRDVTYRFIPQRQLLLTFGFCRSLISQPATESRRSNVKPSRRLVICFS